MTSQLKRGRSDIYRKSTPPWIACVRAVFCSHLRLVWRVLMGVTVLGVSLQLLSAVRQSWNKARPSGHHLINPLHVVHQDISFITENLNANQATFHHFQTDDKDDGRKKVTEPVQNHTSTAEKSLNLKLVSKENDLQVQKQTEVQQKLPKPKLSAQSDNSVTFSASTQNDKCQPKNHIFFLKTHKTASSTILNILYRYGDTHNLTFALPINMYSQFFYPNLFMAHYVEGMQSRRVSEFHIMCNHLRFQSSEVKKIMHLDTFYFSILRNPVSMMESLFTYYKLIPAFLKFKTLQDFLLDNGRSYIATQPNNHYARNILTFDFGFNNTAPESDAELDERAVAMISAVESQFHLILISEYFDESMVLLRHALCWSLEDVMSFRLNSRSDDSRKPLSVEMTEQVKKWSALDWRLYQHFNASFWRRIDTLLGRTKLQEEVEFLRARRVELEQACLLEGKAVNPAKVHDLALKPFQYGQAVIQGYNIRPGLNNDTRQHCQRLIMPELQYTIALYNKQFPGLAAVKAVSKKVTLKTMAQSIPKT